MNKLITILIITFVCVFCFEFGQSFAYKQKDTCVYIDTVVIDTPLNVVGKKALFIGDSHTSAYGWGWQDMLCNQTGMICINTAVGGKTTIWMVSVMEKYKYKEFDYCFIYGGANDAANSSIPVKRVIQNIQRMVDTAHVFNMIPVVIIGTDPRITFTSRDYKYRNYVSKKVEIQKYLQDSINNAIIVDTRFIPRSDCADWICHMKRSGHKKTADEVIKTLNLKTIK